MVKTGGKMKTRYGVAGFIFTLGLLHSAAAADLPAQLSQFFQHQHAAAGNQVTVTLKSPPTQWPQCENAEISLPNNARPWGNLSVSVRCEQQRRFIQVQVAVSGRYLVAARQLAAGDTITAKDLQFKTGRLDTLPHGILLDRYLALGAICIRNIPAGQPLTRTTLRRAWVIKAGQNVQVLAQGAGFTVNSEGKAMNNAAAQETVRVRMSSGQVVTGIATDDGRIMLTMP